jgi:hypothetical protein
MATGERRREKFRPEEDVRLRQLVNVHGANSWDLIASSLPGRNARQCRERWKHYLSSERSSTWTVEEDRLLFEKMQSIGPKWTRLATFFPGRTDMQIKAHWMQTFAHFSDLHVKNRAKKIQLLSPAVPIVATLPIVAPRVQFANQPPPMPMPPAAPPPPQIPRTPTPQRDYESLGGLGRDSSFGSRSFLDLSLWNE